MTIEQQAADIALPDIESQPTFQTTQEPEPLPEDLEHTHELPDFEQQATDITPPDIEPQPTFQTTQEPKPLPEDLEQTHEAAPSAFDAVQHEGPEKAKAQAFLDLASAVNRLANAYEEQPNW